MALLLDSTVRLLCAASLLRAVGLLRVDVGTVSPFSMVRLFRDTARHLSMVRLLRAYNLPCTLGLLRGTVGTVRLCLARTDNWDLNASLIWPSDGFHDLFVVYCLSPLFAENQLVYFSFPGE